MIPMETKHVWVPADVALWVRLAAARLGVSQLRLFWLLIADRDEAAWSALYWARTQVEK